MHRDHDQLSAERDGEQDQGEVDETPEPLTHALPATGKEHSAYDTEEEEGGDELEEHGDAPVAYLKSAGGSGHRV